jgi:TonB family protein
VLSFVIEKDGKLVDMRVSGSSGFDRLDKAAIDTLRRLDRFRPIPDILGRDRWPISVPVEYRLM